MHKLRGLRSNSSPVIQGKLAKKRSA